MWIGFDPSNPTFNAIRDAAAKAIAAGAIGLTITSSDASFVEIPPRVPATPPAAPPAHPIVIADDAEFEVRGIWRRLYGGIFSRKYLKLVAKYCEDNDTEQFTFSELNASAFANGVNGIRAAHRNVSRAMQEEGVQLFKKKWSISEKCQTFTLSKAYREGILACAVADL
jgi:hypothetical protein